MNTDNIQEYISALVDKEVSELSDADLEYLQRMVNEHPEYFGEYRMNIATKLCLIKYAKSMRCPSSTANTIKSMISHMYKSRSSDT